MTIMMRNAALAGALAGSLALVGGTALAQEPEPDRGWGWGDDGDWERDEIPDRLDETLRGLLDRMKPALEDMFEMLGLMEQIDNPLNYEKPIILPNGDILIRRSPDAPDWDPERENTEPEDRGSEPPWRRLAPDGSTRT